MDHDETPINGATPRPARGGRVRAAAEDVSLAFEEHVVWRGGNAARSVFEVARWPFERLLWALQRAVIWPLQDRTALLSGPGRALAGAAVLLVAVAAVAGGVTLAGSGGSSDPAPPATAVATKPVPPAPAPAPEPEPAPAATLHGAAPDFKRSGKGGSSEVDAAEPIQSSPPATASTGSAASSGSAATGTISSAPAAPADSAEAAAAKASSSAVAGRPAGPAAIAVARQFAGAFVLYETGGDKTDVRRAFAATASPELTKSLLRRPPRLPANVKVPKAKVLNVVAGPSRAGVYSVSVSLLRVGVTSELRLSMEKLKKDGWQVTNVLG
jgi:hypothetical protein